MATYTLTSPTGLQSLSPGTAHLFVQITTLGSLAVFGRANPPNRYDVGLLRIGQDDYFYPAIPVDADQQIIAVPSGATHLAWSLIAGSELIVGEDSAPPPVGTSLSISIDGQTVVTGDTFTITFARSDTADPGDWVALVDSGWNTSFGAAFLESAPSPCYVNTCSGTAGTAAVQSGACSLTVQLDSSFTPPLTCRAVYIDGATGSYVAQTSNNITLTG